MAEIHRADGNPIEPTLRDTVTGISLMLVHFRPDALGMSHGERAELAERIANRWNRTGVETLPREWDRADGCFVFADGSKA